MIVTTYENNRCPVADCPHRFAPTERVLEKLAEHWKLWMRWHYHAPPTVQERKTISGEVRVYESGLLRLLGLDDQLAEIGRAAGKRGR